MIGRAAIHQPYYWRHIDTYSDRYTDKYASQETERSVDVCIKNRREILTQYALYANTIQVKHNHPSVPGLLVRPILNLFHSEENSKSFKKVLLESIQYKKKLGKQIEGKVWIGDVIHEAMERSHLSLSALDNMD